MLRHLILAAALIAAATPAPAAVNKRLVRDMQMQISLTAQAERGDAAIKAMLGVACLELIRVGRADLCDDLKADYADAFDGYLTRMVNEEDMGDHTPLSLWLAIVTDLLQLTLGPQVMEWTHLDDLRIMNYAIPVVFHPQASSDWCKDTVGVGCPSLAPAPIGVPTFPALPLPTALALCFCVPLREWQPNTLCAVG
jgi:hypothetical protein